MSERRLAYVLTRFPKVSETFVLDEILGLERRGHRVRVCALRPGRAGDAPTAAQTHVRERLCFALLSPRLLAAQIHWALRSPRRLGAVWRLALSRHRGSLRDLAGAGVAVLQAAAFAIRLKRDGTRHVHAHWATHSALAAWTIHRLTRLPYSFTAHADDIFVRRPMLEEKVAEAEFVVAISEYGRDFLRSQLQRPEAARIAVVHCGVDGSDFVPAPPVEPRRPYRIACVARLEPKKGHDVLLDACVELAERGLDFRCVLVGEGSLRSHLEARCRDGRLRGRVELLGARPRATVREWIERSHVVALPCVVAASGRADGIPVALMEAMALARPVVTTPVSGIPELVEDGVSGLLVPPGDPVALAFALARLSDEPLLAERLARAGRKRVERDFELSGNVERLAALFDHPERAAPEDDRARLPGSPSAAKVGA